MPGLVLTVAAILFPTFTYLRYKEDLFINRIIILKDDSDSLQQQLDLVMLTNGWRRIKWDEAVNGKTPKLLISQILHTLVERKDLWRKLPLI